uniref:4a-hydroxytetrahydrobiopterin dehydratase n=1 Tax=Colletotrichum fructicola (strain Nara gc5) TaxID=1213859 RepID=L2GG31_COLFN
MANAQPQARFSEGSDEASLSSTLDTLLSKGRWALVNEGEAVERNFKFKNFAKTWDFMTAVSLQCKTHNHHPEWSNVYNTTFIRWTTHSPKGLSVKDLKLAMICDALAKDFGEVEAPAAETPDEGASCGVRGPGPPARPGTAASRSRRTDVPPPLREKLCGRWVDSWDERPEHAPPLYTAV